MQEREVQGSRRELPGASDKSVNFLPKERVFLNSD